MAATLSELNIGPGTAFTATVSDDEKALYNSNVVTAQVRCGTRLSWKPVTAETAMAVKLSKGKKVAFALSMTALTADDAGSVFETLAAAGERAADGVFLHVDMPSNASFYDRDQRDYAIDGAAALAMFRRPGVALFAAERCDEAGAADDEGACARVTARLTLAEGAGTDGMRVTLRAASDQRQVSQDFSLDDRLAALLAGETAAVIVPDIEFSVDSDWRFELGFGDEYESATAATELPKAFSNVHLSSFPGGGVAFGRFSTAADKGRALFECAYPAVLDQGVEVDWRAMDEGADGAVVTPGSNGYGNGRLGVGRVGDHVYIRGGVEARAGNVLGNVGIACAPALGNIYHMAACGGARIARLMMKTDGTLNVEWVRNLSDGAAYTAAVWIDCNFDYWRA